MSPHVVSVMDIGLGGVSVIELERLEGRYVIPSVPSESGEFVRALEKIMNTAPYRALLDKSSHAYFIRWQGDRNLAGAEIALSGHEIGTVAHGVIRDRRDLPVGSYERFIDSDTGCHVLVAFIP